VSVAATLGAALPDPDVLAASLADELASAQAETSNVIVTNTAPGPNRVDLARRERRPDNASKAAYQPPRLSTPVAHASIAATGLTSR
jgi:hypothetical protein